MRYCDRKNNFLSAQDIRSSEGIERELSVNHGQKGGYKRELRQLAWAVLLGVTLLVLLRVLKVFSS